MAKGLWSSARTQLIAMSSEWLPQQSCSDFWNGHEQGGCHCNLAVLDSPDFGDVGVYWSSLHSDKYFSNTTETIRTLKRYRCSSKKRRERQIAQARPCAYAKMRFTIFPPRKL